MNKCQWNFNQNKKKILMKTHLKLSPAKWWLFCPDPHNLLLDRLLSERLSGPEAVSLKPSASVSVSFCASVWKAHGDGMQEYIYYKMKPLFSKCHNISSHLVSHLNECHLIDLLTCINFNPSIVSNHMPCKMWDEITYQFPNFNGCAAEVWEWISNFTHTL